MTSTFGAQFIINEPMSNTRDELRDVIRRKLVFWFSDSVFTNSERQVKGAAWVITIEDENGLKLDIAQMNAAPKDLISIQASVIVGPGHRNAFSQLAPAARTRYLNALQFRLLLLGVEFVGVTEPLEGVIVQHFCCYSESIGKDEFFQKVSLVRRAAFAVSLALDQLHDNNGPASSSDSVGHQEPVN